jgi:hypothetical protein
VALIDPLLVFQAAAGAVMRMKTGGNGPGTNDPLTIRSLTWCQNYFREFVRHGT